MWWPAAAAFRNVQGQGIRVDLDIRKPNWKDEMCEKVKDLYDKDLLGKEIAQELEFTAAK